MLGRSFGNMARVEGSASFCLNAVILLCVCVPVLVFACAESVLLQMQNGLLSRMNEHLDSVNRMNKETLQTLLAEKDHRQLRCGTHLFAQQPWRPGERSLRPRVSPILCVLV